MQRTTRALALAIFALLATGAHAANQRPALLTADRVGTGEGSPKNGWAVLVSNGRIEAVGPADKLSVPPDAERIDLPGMTV